MFYRVKVVYLNPEILTWCCVPGSCDVSGPWNLCEGISSVLLFPVPLGRLLFPLAGQLLEG